MKKFIVSIAAVVVLVALLGSCVSLRDRELTPEEKEKVQIIGSVSTSFSKWNLFHAYNKNTIIIKAHAKLLAAAQKKYGQYVEVHNIVIGGSFSFFEFLPIIIPGFYLLAPVWVNAQKIVVTGDVVSMGSGAVLAQLNKKKLDDALYSTAAKLIFDLPHYATIAILSIQAGDEAAAEYIINELEYKFVDAKKFRIVDRRRLDQLRKEQDFQLSGEVSDDSAVSIGNMLGATIVITGDVTRVASNNQLVLRALDVQTAQIILIVREQF